MNDMMPHLITLRVSHHVEYAVELILMVGVIGFDVFLLAVEYWFVSKKLRKDATDSPYV